MEKTTEENSSINEGENLIKEIESNFKLLLKTSPDDIEEDIRDYYDKFITLTKGPEKDKIFEKLDILNTIIN